MTKAATRAVMDAKAAEAKLAKIARTRRPTDDERREALVRYRAAAVATGGNVDIIDEAIADLS